MISALRIRFWGSFLRSSLPFFPGGPSPMASVLYTRGRFKQTNYPGFPQNFLKFREFSPCPPLVTPCLTIKYPSIMGIFAFFLLFIYSSSSFLNTAPFAVFFGPGPGMPRHDTFPLPSCRSMATAGSAGINTFGRCSPRTDHFRLKR